MYAPGVGDDTANLVALLMAARHLAHNPQLMPAEIGVLVVANSCEEGLGNLRGTKQLFEQYGPRIRRFYSFDLYLPQVIDEAVGSHRWKIEVRTQGGHSYSNFGRPNAIERLCAILQALYALPLPQDVPCTINVGRIEGGTTVNAIAAQAKALFEYRSTSDAVLRDMRHLVRATVEGFASEDVEVSMKSVGRRPATAGHIEGLAEMTELSREVMCAVTGEEPVGKAASTDANIPLSRGVPANTLGAVRGALLHTRDEWVDSASVEDGMAVVMGIMLVQSEL
jgi:acetylornithine deacetylase/succinyl-diaminopimelate desuccinylase-like protein